MNPIGLFPRLSIRAKLAIAFAGIAIVPVTAVATLGVRHTLRQARAFAVMTLEHDVAEARAQTQQRVRTAEQDLSYVAEHLLGARLRAGWPEDDTAAVLGTARFLERRPLHVRMKAIGPGGALVEIVDSEGGIDAPPRVDEGAYYAFRAELLADGEHDIVPVEVRDLAAGAAVRPVVAIIEAVRDAHGGFAGAVVAEVDASEMFRTLENSTQGLEGVTGLIDSEGHLLYHSTRKSDWSLLLADRTALDLEQELSGGALEAVLATPRLLTLAVEGNRTVVSAPLVLLGERSPRLTVYRILPTAILDAEARRFVASTLIVGLTLLAGVILLATLAAHQLTRPIYRLREAARRLADGRGLEAPLDVETRDEIQDLADDFSLMANALAAHRRGLENLVEDRTRALGETSAELEGILQYSADAIVGTDLSGRVRLWNDGARNLFGLEPEAAVGRVLDEIIRPEGERWRREAEFIATEMAAQGVLSNFQTRRRGRNGEETPVSLTQTAIRDQAGKVFGYSLIFRDTTAQTRLEEQMRRSERLAALSAMAGGLAHEMGNPLAIIENRIECMQQEVISESRPATLEADLDVLSQHANRLHGLIGDFLAFARDGGEPHGHVDLGGVVGRVSTLLDRTFRTRGVELAVRVDADTPVIPGNERAVETALMNLLLNALDATPPGGQVAVSTISNPDENTLTLSVSDTGHGIPESIRHQVLEPFFTTKEPGRGTGLGLAVCAAVVERHGGSLDVESEEGRGTVVSLSFPLNRYELQWQAAESS